MHNIYDVFYTTFHYSKLKERLQQIIHYSFFYENDKQKHKYLVLYIYCLFCQGLYGFQKLHWKKLSKMTDIQIFIIRYTLYVLWLVIHVYVYNKHRFTNRQKLFNIACLCVLLFVQSRIFVKSCLIWRKKTVV